jgi:hypothetical protein
MKTLVKFALMAMLLVWAFHQSATANSCDSAGVSACDNGCVGQMVRCVAGCSAPSCYAGCQSNLSACMNGCQTAYCPAPNGPPDPYYPPPPPPPDDDPTDE